MVQTKVVEKIKTHILCRVTFFYENHAVYEIMWKNIVDPAGPHCMLDAEEYKYTLRVCNTYCFSTTTVVARMRLNVMLYIHRLSC
jgi:hypothetical protein